MKATRGAAALLLVAVAGCTPTGGGDSPSAAPAAEDAAVRAPAAEDAAVRAPATTARDVPPPPGAVELPHPSGAVGFGADATGGVGTGPVWVTSLEDDGPGSLRAAAARPGPSWIRFAVDGTIRLEDRIRVRSSTTIDGRGADVTISGDGLRLQGVEDVVITGLRFDGGHNTSGTDAIWVHGGSRDIWIDHNEFADYADGLIDITLGATDVTVSWNRFTDHGKVMLIMWPSLAEGGRMARPPMRVTVHHNLFEGTETRHPLLRYAHVHAFNNVLDGWEGYGIDAQVGAQLLSERNAFLADDEDRAIVSRDRPERADPNPGRGWVRSDGDLLRGGAVVQERNADGVFQPPYDYEAAPADDRLVAQVRRGAGTA